MRALEPLMDADEPDHMRELELALDAVAEAMQDNVARSGMILRKVGELQAGIAIGRPLHEIVAHEERPLIVELLTENISNLNSAGCGLRRSEARALHDQGLTMAQIAEHFGVTRQRIHALLRDDD